MKTTTPPDRSPAPTPTDRELVERLLARGRQLREDHPDYEPAEYDANLFDEAAARLRSPEPDEGLVDELRKLADGWIPAKDGVPLNHDEYCSRIASLRSNVMHKAADALTSAHREIEQHKRTIEHLRFAMRRSPE